ncbi:uncharacterized protein LOC115255535 [Aedes albopictus]|uniref:Tc1-like transposase DDE domain-containing protein n=1 Tax=Aedes albopictus TaxID=7160 RepID=A0ABM1YEQ9_AEDAL|nr:uncharacterized protein LOC115255535 [Aedes albopictus]
MVGIRENVFGQHASVNTVYHCLYGYYYLGIRKCALAKIYAKHHTTISQWIRRYEENKYFGRKERAKVYLQFGAKERSWIVDLYKNCPILYLNETKEQFERTFHKAISTASINRILHSEGYSWKVLERRAIQLRQQDIYRFHSDMSTVSWDIHNLVFLDEVSFDSRGMLRNKGYAPVGDRLVYRGEFIRRPRCSMLSFLGSNGIIETFSTEGTFTRKVFFDCVRSFALSGVVKRHPGQYSTWVMDGARIHCHKAIVEYLRSLGINVIFLPAYAPFYNPIEYVFGYLKRYLKKTYIENSSKDLTITICEALAHFKDYDCSKIFKKCGYLPGGSFDPSIGLGQDMKTFGFKM